MGVGTPPIREATIDGAWIPIVAGEAAQPYTVPSPTDIAGRTGVLIVANLLVRSENAAQDGVTCIISARISIVTYGGFRAGCTSTVRTGVTEGTGVVVITRGGIRCRHTAGGWIATIRGAE